MLDFQPVTIGSREVIQQYMMSYGGGSCQHSFVSSFCLYGKYGDMFCEHEGSLYVLRSKKCCGNERVYLFPMGDVSGVKSAVDNVLNDAHENNSLVKFETVTESAKDIITNLFPGKFSVEYSRDLSEYVYRTEHQVNLPGHELATKRKNIHKFFRDYDGRCSITRITPEHIEGIRTFQREWLASKLLSEYDLQHDLQLEQENDGIQTALDNFFALGLSGIVLFIDGSIKGYAYGAPLSEKVFDAIVEKGDKNIPNIYRVLNREFSRLCCEGYEYINREEDLGIEGLRTTKTRYKPEYMIEKFILNEHIRS